MTGYVDIYSDTYVADSTPTVYVVNTWSGGYAIGQSNTATPPPGTLSLPVGVENSTGNWLIACIAWRNPPGYDAPYFTVADDVHNWWEPLLVPNGSVSNADGLTMCSIWMAPAARAAGFVHAAPTSYSPAYAMTIYEVTGLLPWVSTSAATGYANSSTTLDTSLGAPSSQAVIFAASGTDNLSDEPVTLGGSGWGTVTTQTAANLTDHTADIVLSSAWQVTTGATTADWSASGSVNFAASIGGPLTNAPALSGLSPAWPAMIYETAPGSGVQTPPDALTWQSLSGQALELSGLNQGRQYEASQLSTGEGTLKLDNPLGNLVPPGTGSLAGIDSGTPVRLRAAWTGGSWQVSFTGNGSTANPEVSTNQVFTVTPDTAYSASAWLACSPAYSPGVALLIGWYNSSGTFLSSVSSAYSSGLAAVLETVSGTAPGSAAFAAVIVQAGGTPPAATTFYASAAPPDP